MAEATIQLGGGNWAGKSDNLLGYYKEGERFYKQDFTFSRSTTGTYTDKDGYIQEMPYNEVTYSEQFDLWAISGSITRTSNIATAPNGTLTADGIQDTSGGSYKRVRKSISVNPNSTYTSSCYIKKVTSETAYTGFGLVFSGGTQKLAYGIIDSVNGTITSASSTITPTFNVVSVGDYWRFEMTATDNGSNSSLEFSIYATLSTNGTSLNVGIGSIRTLWGAQINKGTSAKTYFPTTTRLNMPRVDYLNNSNGSLILEPQSTNTVTYSDDFSQWTLGGLITPTLTSGQLSPSGEYNATKISGTIGSSILYIPGTTSETATRSIYAKTVSGTGTARLMSYFGNTNNLFTLTEEWQRFELTGSSIVGGTNFYIDFRDSAQTLNEFIIWGTQSEELPYPTTLINTSGSSVTRNADVCTDGGDASRFNDNEGVLYAEIAALEETSSSSKYISISDETYNNRLSILFSSGATNQVRAFLRVGGTPQVDFNGSVTDVTDYNKVAFKYKANDFALWINGVEVATDISGSVFSADTLTKLSLSEINTTSNKFEGKVKQIQYYNTALTDSELATLTTL